MVRLKYSYTRYLNVKQHHDIYFLAYLILYKPPLNEPS